MGFLDWLKSRHRSSLRHRSPTAPLARPIESRLLAVEEMMMTLGREVGTISILLQKHEDQLILHEYRLGEHTVKLESLIRATAEAPTVRQAIPEVPSSPLPALCPSTEDGPVRSSVAGRFEIDQFTDQQKRILGVFFQDKKRRMSYVDVAAILGKSTHTVKNQINQIRQRADLFEQMIGPENRNFFKLKDDVRIEKYLNCGQPVERPAPTVWPASSNNPPQSVDRAP